MRQRYLAQRLDRAIDECRKLGITREEAFAVMSFMSCREAYNLYAGLTKEDKRAYYMEPFDKAFGRSKDTCCICGAKHD